MEDVVLQHAEQLKHWEEKQEEILQELIENQQKIHQQNDLYYNEKEEARIIERYYEHMNDQTDGTFLFQAYHDLIKRTHIRRIPYFLSKDYYLYTWVDLQPDGTVKSIYSGKKKDPRTVILQDYETIQKRYEQFIQLVKKAKKGELDLEQKIKMVDRQFKFNAEHVVPQSWFGAKEPMKGDLHHLFVCEPRCNSIRSNFPYADFPFYEPESPDEMIQNDCGVAYGEYFEPEHGKGAVARAMLYFLVRYPRAIKQPFIDQINISLLIQWHKQFPVTMYEKHRNAAIFRIQGNRNPFIDKPHLVEQIYFLIGRKSG
ncbi:endonuclease [Anoxybacillus salavatliensis]|uniref:endonuclease I family protein n=1 Tax=Anoxybacillus gonensis TaxID=198467 RepID=UPI0002BD88F2|nr:endonuclease [Anoxybacillus gonensis]EMI11132.1 Extracellular ribonuclease [Anoxybacillus gonensis]MCQ5365220.1 endonuclease [Anoxybacillus gonensis]